jgi:hypothetical protein
VALQGEEVFELVYDALDELTLARRPATVGLRPSSLGIILGRGGDQSSVTLKPMLLPGNRGEALVGQEVGVVSVLGDEEVPYLGRSSAAASANPKAQITPSGLTERATLKP